MHDSLVTGFGRLIQPLERKIIKGGVLSPLWVAFSILVGGLLLDVLISVTLGVSALPVNIIIGITLSDRCAGTWHSSSTGARVLSRVKCEKSGAAGRSKRHYWVSSGTVSQTFPCIFYERMCCCVVS
ncbi:hypothetical protein SASPL_143017 [Salvia splendens]|uniref:Uncharacterized protein n=1 Tax=Salvia splendens TaxID=180675 RepID=A0A8X8WLR9_SALSN|nr:hypothetical protein SASPL_143017 [Salvia splendens]